MHTNKFARFFFPFDKIDHSIELSISHTCNNPENEQKRREAKQEWLKVIIVTM